MLSTSANQLDSSLTRETTQMSHTSLPNRSLTSTFYQSYELLPTVFFLPPSLPSSGFCRLFLHFCRHGNIAGRFTIQPPPRQLPPPPCCGGCLGHLCSIVLWGAARGIFEILYNLGMTQIIIKRLKKIVIPRKHLEGVASMLIISHLCCCV